MAYSFNDEYKRLNKAQKQAVNKIDGPLLVIAGPGTGKTQLLGMRVANILQKTDTDARSILCLTFTNKAATNMRERLVSLIGPDANAVQVKTFHSFASDIMAQHPDYFWNGARLTTAPDAVQLNVIHDILSNLPLDNPLALRYSGQLTAINDVQNGLRLTKEAGLTPEKLRSIIQVNQAYLDLIEPKLIDILSPSLSVGKLNKLLDSIKSLPEQPIDKLITPLLSLKDVIIEGLEFAVSQDLELGKATKTGVWKRRWIQTVDGQKGMLDERRRNEWWLKLADVYASYRDELGKRGYYDYSDMLVQVISQLEQSAELKAQVQEQFLYLLIDEFQDTNAAQLRLAHLVAVHEQDPQPNLMAVGDDDQSIFKFNGAELNNMLSFQRNYPTSGLVVLKDNYRSTQAVLDTAGGIIELATDRLVKREPTLTKKLKATRPPDGKSRIEHQLYPTREHQYSMLASEISRRRDNRPKETIAVLARSHNSLKTIAASLHKENIPIRYENKQNILEHETVQQILLLSEGLVAIGNGDARRTSAALSKLLRHPMWKISPSTLWRLAQSTFNQPKWLEKLLDSRDKKLETIGLWLIWLSQEASYQPLPVLLEYMLGIRGGEYMNSPVRSYFVDQKTTSFIYLETLSAVHTLRGLVEEYCVGNTPSLKDFNSFIELNLSNNRTITDSSWFSSSPSAVELLSVHKAKGLEFDNVYIVDAVENEWQPHKAGRKPPANLPLQPYGDDYDDYVRLLYVAMTRAKRNIIVSSYAHNDKGEPVLPTPMIHQLPTAQLASIPQESSILALENALRWPRLDNNNEKQLLKDRLENYRLSVTHLLGFLDVRSGGPQTLFERHLLCLPAIKTPAESFGIAAHKAMETAQKLTNNSRFDISKVLIDYEEALRNEHMPDTEYNRYLTHGQQTLGYLFSELAYKLPPGSLPEQQLSAEVGDIRLTGLIDRIDNQNTPLVITDYKTGQPLSSFDTRDKTKQIKAWKQRTQLIFYTLLLQSHPRFINHKQTLGQIVYLEAGSSRQLIKNHTATSEELEQLTLLIQKVWRRIMSLDFPDTSKYSPDIIGIQSFIKDLLNDDI